MRRPAQAIGAWVDLAPHWDGLYQIARARQKQKHGMATNRYHSYTGEVSNFVGLLGEATIALLTGMKVDRTLRIAGDQGFDFELKIAGDQGKYKVRYDVKASPVVGRSHLIEFCDQERWAADIYILVEVDRNFRRGRVVGWVRREQMQNAPIRDFGWGDRYAYSREELAQLGQLGLPPLLEYMRRRQGPPAAEF